jgi:hypothetical protein
MTRQWTEREMETKAQYLLDWYDDVQKHNSKVANIYGSVSRVCNYLEGSDYPAEYESDRRRHEAIQDEYHEVYNSLWHYARS